MKYFQMSPLTNKLTTEVQSRWSCVRYKQQGRLGSIDIEIVATDTYSETCL